MKTHPESNSEDLSRGEKILVFMYEFSKGGRDKIRYEDIVTGLFKRYPHDFHLKGYAEYPDSGDMIHKPLYDFKKKGYVNAVNKVFSLTERGAEYAMHLITGGSKPPDSTNGRLSRSAETEFSRVKSLEGLELFLKSEQDKLSDNDFYSYLGVTVRTQKNAFLGRLETMNAIADELASHENDNYYTSVVKYHRFLMEKHKDIIDFFTKN
ncbi:MAG: hypothetical protein WBL19_01020 [Minisyncoccia bacterium]